MIDANAALKCKNKLIQFHNCVIYSNLLDLAMCVFNEFVTKILTNYVGDVIFALETKYT